jgi:type II secretory pathway pseudopilin PulG
MTGFVTAKDCRSGVASGGGATRSRAGLAATRRQCGLDFGRPPGKRARAAGFTYIGILMLVAILSISVTLVSELWYTAQKREKEQELLFVGDQFRRALAMYSANGGSYPKKLEELLKDSRIPGVRRYLRKIYSDPITGGTEWGLVRAAGDVIVGVYSLSNEQPLKQAEFSLANKAFEGKKKYSEWVFSSTPAEGKPGATTPANAGAPTPADSSAAQGDPRPQSRVRR